MSLPFVLAHSGGLGPVVEGGYAMPPWVLWSVGAAVVAVSFAVVGAFLTRASFGLAHAERPGPAVGVPLARGGAWLPRVALAVLVLAALQPLWGGDGALPEVLAWLVLWAILPIVAYLWRDPWPAIDPFRAVEPLVQGRARWRYPSWLGAWPAVVILLALVLLEVFDDLGHDAATLGLLLGGYLALTIVGMALFGAAAWRAHAEVFGRTLRAWGSMAPPWRAAERLAREPAEGLSGVALVVALLYGVNFDGFLLTPLGQSALGALAGPLGALGAHAAVLLLGYAAFLGAFLLCALWIRRASESLRSPVALAAAFAPSLLPIAAGYHLAHNLPYLLARLPALLGALADPLGLGWRPLDAALAGLDLVPSPQAVGVFQMVLIVAAHVLSVVVAHRLAFGAFDSRVQAIRSEFPLTALMVLYTFVGLALVGGGYAPATGGL